MRAEASLDQSRKSRNVSGISTWASSPHGRRVVSAVGVTGFEPATSWSRTISGSALRITNGRQGRFRPVDPSVTPTKSHLIGAHGGTYPQRLMSPSNPLTRSDAVDDARKTRGDCAPLIVSGTGALRRGRSFLAGAVQTPRALLLAGSFGSKFDARRNVGP